MIWGLLGGLVVLVALLALPRRARRGRDLKALRQALEGLGAGDFRVRYYPEDSGFSALAEAFNLTARGLEQRMYGLAGDKSELEAILRHLADAVVLLSRKKRLLRLNPAAVALFQVSPAAVSDRPYLGLIRDSLLDAQLDQVLVDGQPRVFTSSLGRGPERSYDVYLIPVHSEQPLGVLLVIRDMTEAHRLERLRTELVSNVSHELRTPLTSIKGFTETLLSGAAENVETRERFLRIIATETDRLIRLTADLLDLSRWDEGSGGPRGQVDLNRLAETEVRRFQERQDRAAIVLEPAADELSVLGNGEELALALGNLLDNALKYTPKEGVVTVRLDRVDDSAVLTVADTGPGIPAADLPRIFERFYRVAKDRSRQSGGSGLGLAIVKHLVEGNGGWVSVESRLDEGTTFTIRLPLSDMAGPGLA